MEAQALLKFHMQDLRFYLNFTDIEISNVRMKRDHIGLSDTNFGATLQKVLTAHADAFNSKFSSGVHISEYYPRLQMVGGLIKNSTLTPYVKDGWLYGGYSMQSDINALQS